MVYKCFMYKDEKESIDNIFLHYDKARIVAAYLLIWDFLGDTFVSVTLLSWHRFFVVRLCGLGRLTMGALAGFCVFAPFCPFFSYTTCILSFF